MKFRKILLIHLAILVILITLLIIFSEVILNFFSPEFHQVEMWIGLIIFGSITIFILTLISFIFSVILNKRRKKTAGNTLLLRLPSLFYFS